MKRNFTRYYTTTYSQSYMELPQSKGWYII